jgi:hypothetical protein
MADTTSTPQHCPGYQNFKTLKAFTCKCPKCGEVKEIFSDEFDIHRLFEMSTGRRRKKHFTTLIDRS